MPKVVVLFSPSDSNAEPLARAAAAGTERVRFTETDVRAVATSRDEGAPAGAEMDSCDGIIVVATTSDAAASIGALLPELGARSPGSRGADTVFAFIGDASRAAADRVLAAGGIIVSIANDQTPVDHASSVGERVAKVVEWVRHARSHEHAHSHSHSHSHDHAHDVHGHAHHKHD